MNEGPIETRFELEIRRLADLSMERRKEPLLSRLKPVKNLRAVLVKRAKEFVDAAREDLGKSPGEVLGGEILPLAEACRFLGRNARKILASRRSSRSPLWLGDQQWVCRMPHGVVGIIGTWNYPFSCPGCKLSRPLPRATVWFGSLPKWLPNRGRSWKRHCGRRVLAQIGWLSFPKRENTAHGFAIKRLIFGVYRGRSHWP